MIYNATTACRRLQVLTRLLNNEFKNNWNKEFLTFRYCSASVKQRAEIGENSVTIGEIKKIIVPPKRPELVPSRYLGDNLDQETLHHLRWMLQKDSLKQDIFLVGRPGPLKRRVAMQFLEATQKELEFVSLSRDTTEADLKQRREIESATSKYINQSAVRAALEGRVLVLEGIEKAERNVLPVLNNLLENREMHLEDGRFLIPAERYDKLIKEFGADQMNKWRLLRVNEDFRVIALGLPVPGYQGNPLDPPLRSRFQARDVPPIHYHDALERFRNDYPGLDDKITTLLSCAYTLISPEATSMGLPDFPVDNLPSVVKIMSQYPWIGVNEAMSRLYPIKSLLPEEGIRSINGLLENFQVGDGQTKSRVTGIERETIDKAQVTLTTDHQAVSQVVPCGELELGCRSKEFITEYQEELLSSLVQSHCAGDFCLVGPRGCGKSLAISQFANLLGYTVEPIVLYQDMSSRDLIQQRTTLDNGDTVWRNAPLVTAALQGKLAVLDGLHRLHPSTLALLHRLVHERELQLYDGTRLMDPSRYDSLASKVGEESLIKSGILRIHPSFRIIALAEPNSHIVGDTSQKWLNPELLSLFLYHEMRPLDINEESFLIEKKYGELNKCIRDVLQVSHALKDSKDGTLHSLSGSLSTRQLMRIAKRTSAYPHQGDAHSVIHAACLAKFLPPLAKQALDSVLHRMGISKSSSVETSSVGKILVDDELTTIGKTVIPRYKSSDTSKVPDILFYDVPQHVLLLERLAQDFVLGEHLLLVGNQGVGKNKLADRLLQLLNRPREYIQLHRDTTVQCLTIQPTVVGGVVSYEDSPLVTAVKTGRVLVVDEADKAPTYVTCILKSLVENGEMILSDGRRIVPADDPRISTQTPDLIPIHPDFRMIVLANRPGFPFLGNDFFAALGDLFSCHSVDNPSVDSERELLMSYGPNVPVETINKLVAAFSKLRSLADQGLVSYPYSTRELVNIIKHLQAFPEDSLSDAVGNVFDFDRYSQDMRETLLEVLEEFNIQIAMSSEERAAKRKKIQMTIEKESGKDVSGPKHGKEDETGAPHVGGNTWAGGTGGRDTAGLGGKGGPYRLDAGHDVYQVSDAEKAAVPEHIRKAAREMGQKAFKAKLEEIKMSAYDHTLYEEYASAVTKQVQALRVILSSLQAKSKERQWSKNQTSGELDDTKLIEGLTGERNIYKRRSEKEPEMGSPQMKPKRLKLVVDVSGSMYRFNGYDGRLDRQLEAAVMLMESFEGFETRFQYDIVGHSGESPSIQFVDKSKSPANNKERLEIMRLMHAHSQFCMSGDYTLEAIEDAVKSLSKEDCDEAFVVVLSDANMARYAIPPTELARSLTLDPKVEAFAVFIGSLGNEAVKLSNSLPAGRGFVCLDVKELPKILQSIFTSSMLRR